MYEVYWYFSFIYILKTISLIWNDCLVGGKDLHYLCFPRIPYDEMFHHYVWMERWAVGQRTSIIVSIQWHSESNIKFQSGSKLFHRLVSMTFFNHIVQSSCLLNMTLVDDKETYLVELHCIFPQIVEHLPSDFPYAPINTEGRLCNLTKIPNIKFTRESADRSIYCIWKCRNSFQRNDNLSTSTFLFHSSTCIILGWL